jgi:hypothetical protein
VQIAQLLRAIDAVIADLEQIERALRRNDRVRVVAIAKGAEPHVRRADELSRTLGASACAGG